MGGVKLDLLVQSFRPNEKMKEDFYTCSKMSTLTYNWVTCIVIIKLRSNLELYTLLGDQHCYNKTAF